MKFTQEQLDNWRAYEDVRVGGRYNMFDLRAQKASGLTQREYVFVMEHFNALKQEAGASTTKERNES